MEIWIYTGGKIEGIKLETLVYMLKISASTVIPLDSQANHD